jgi:energy-coupling factor transporter ATP-binding protein EcfA2
MPKPSVTIITGRRGSGKDVTAVALALAIQEETEKPVLSNYDPGRFKLPRDWRLRPGNAFEANSVQLISDAHLEYFSRDWQSSPAETLVKVVSVSRHRNIDFIYTTQLSSLIDRQVISNIDVMIFKEPSLLAAEFERKELDEFTKQAQEYYYRGSESRNPKDHENLAWRQQKLSQMEKWTTAIAFTHDKGKIIVTDINKPAWFTEEMSKIFGQTSEDKQHFWERIL